MILTIFFLMKYDNSPENIIEFCIKSVIVLKMDLVTNKPKKHLKTKVKC